MNETQPEPEFDDAVRPDLVIFDSIMCLLVGSMLDEATWAPMKPLVCELSARHIAQIWFNHVNDLGKSFGDKTREWEMDTVAKLSKVEDDETAIRLEFIKARLRTPKTAGQFAPLIIRPNDGWQFEIAKRARGGKTGGDVEMVRDEFLKVYDHLADAAQKSLGLDDRSTVLKVSIAEPFFPRQKNLTATRVCRTERPNMEALKISLKLAFFPLCVAVALHLRCKQRCMQRAKLLCRVLHVAPPYIRVHCNAETQPERERPSSRGGQIGKHFRPRLPIL